MIDCNENWMGKFGPFGDYVIPWYGAEIERLEASSPTDEDERIALLERVDDMLTELDDLDDEGFTALSDAFNKVHDAGRRLDILRATHLRENDSEKLRLLPRADRVSPAFEIIPGFGPPQPLEVYLEKLCAIDFGDVPGAIREGEAWKQWRQAAQAILGEQAAFARLVFSERPDGLVCLLRDMLPQYLIARRVGMQALGLPLGRAYLDRFGPNYDAYDCITGPLYSALRQEPADFDRMWAIALRELENNLISVPYMTALAEALHREAGPLLPYGSICVLETGLQATMPLLLGAIFPQARRWMMYTAAPWLLDIYHDRIFRHRYAALRPCETLACTENLFQVIFDGGRWHAREALDPVIRGRAYWEIATIFDMAT